MTPIKKINNHFTSIITAATQEIQNLKMIIADTQGQITRLQAENVQIERDLTEAQTALARRVQQLDNVQRLVGIDPNNPQENLEQRIRDLVDAHRRQGQQIAALQQRHAHEQNKLNKVTQKLLWLTGGAIGAVTTTVVGIIAYKVAKVVAGAQAGAMAGAAVGVAAGAPAGPLMLGTAPAGAVVGGVIGGIVALVIP